MEGYTPTIGCSYGCTGCFRGWVSRPRLVFPRRDPLIDAVGKTDNPCDRPARYPPCCKAEPKFRLPRELPECDNNCYRQEQAEAKRQAEYDAWMKEGCCCSSPNQCLEVESLDPYNYPLVCDPQPETPPTHLFHYREQPYRTNILAGWFNPGDNKTRKQSIQEQCDKYWRACGPSLRPYPCRGVVRLPPKRWVSVAEESKDCNLPEICAGSKYITPEYRCEQEERLRAEMEAKMLKERCACQQRELDEWADEWGPCYPHPKSGLPGSNYRCCNNSQ